MRVVNTDNYGRDYPNEKFVSETISLEEAKKLCDRLNEKEGPNSDRYHQVVDDDYRLQPGFTP